MLELADGKLPHYCESKLDILLALMKFIICPPIFLENVCKLLSHLSALKNLLLISVLWNYEWEDT